ncbi:RNA polymerase sigma factor [uncultured Caudovirales phage]|uniref:RNA polymerase sigma-like factor n=1 Tax=uncultured Caudovirales phage TaxID=2100421 RepID=A0A6J5LFT9_9CAUD|nr:RNA polymerase sigma factor [uncultured Caudovirales phage]
MTAVKPIKKQKHYINNPDFLAALNDYKIKCSEAQAKGKDDPPIPNYIGECWMKIAEGLSHKPNFINYTYRDEMISDGIENCLMYFRNFNPDKSNNPFAYFTQIIYFAFLRRIQKEKKQLYVKYKATEQMGILDEFELMEFEDGTTKQFELYDNITEFIGNFEEAKNKKKAIKKPKGLESFLDDVEEVIEELGGEE